MYGSPAAEAEPLSQRSAPSDPRSPSAAASVPL